jgi:hypothetical protein
VLRQHHLDTGILDNVDGVISTRRPATTRFFRLDLKAGYIGLQPTAAGEMLSRRG